MKKRFIVANWKSNKNSQEAKGWLVGISNFQFPISNEKEVIICPPFTLLSTLRTAIDEKSMPVKLGAQNISPFAQGAYTGEINAAQAREFAEYVLIGHSERRTHFAETDEMLVAKVKQALAVGLEPIFCIQSDQTAIPDGVTIVAYEPIEAIGSGHPDTPDDAAAVAQAVKEKYPSVTAVLYGGSVKADNVQDFTSVPSIDGVLVGGASLDAEEWDEIITNA